MAVNPATWLVHTSALTRLDRLEVRRVLTPRIQAGRIAMSIVTDLEVGFSARSAKHYDGVRRRVLDNLIPVFVSPRAEQRARSVQKELIRSGQHRAVAVPDLMVAAVAEVERLTVLHYDADFELIASVTGQATEWVVERGSID